MVAYPSASAAEGKKLKIYILNLDVKLPQNSLRALRVPAVNVVPVPEGLVVLRGINRLAVISKVSFKTFGNTREEAEANLLCSIN